MTLGLSIEIAQKYTDPPINYFTEGFTEVDVNSDITIVSNKVTVDTMVRNITSYVVKDFGAGYFGDYDIDFEVEVTGGSGTGLSTIISLSNTLGDLQDGVDANDIICHQLYNNNSNLQIYLNCQNTDEADIYTDGGDTSSLLYCTTKRVGSIATLYIYSDSARETLVDTLSITCETGTKRYLYAVQSRGAGDPDTISYYVQNLRIKGH